MRLLLSLAIIGMFISCNNSQTDNNLPSKSQRESVGQDIIGIWELLKEKSKKSQEPYLVDPSNKEYLEIKKNGNCQDGRYEAKWYLSYSEDFIFDSTSKVIFTEFSNLTPDMWGDYDRKIKSFQLKITTENNKKYLYLTSLASSDTRIYIRKN